MARDTPSLYALEPGPKPDQTLAEDKTNVNDCLPCRVMGGGAFIGLGVYSYISGQSRLRQQQAGILNSKSMFGMRSRQAGITSIAATLVGLGIYRLVN